MGTTTEMIKKIIKTIFFILIISNIILASRWVFDGNIFFHTDIARDFLLMEDIVDNNNLTLIGPRSGAIPGLFHGPLWLYSNIPAFVLGQGDPVVVGWFWVFFYTLSVYIAYLIGNKMFGETEGLLSALLLSVVTVLQVRSLFNPYGALLLFPLFFYVLTVYLRKKDIKILLLSLFLVGLIIQFQMAFGVPILILSFFYLLYFFFKNKIFSHLFSFFILLIPLSSFLLFDVRNNFLQLNSVISYIGGQQSHGKLDLNFFQLVVLRIKESVVDGFGVITQGNLYLSISILLLFIFAVYLNIKRKRDLLNLNLFLYFYFGFWFMTIFFKGPVWNYYFIPFIPLLILMLVSLKNYLNKFLFYFLFTLIYIVNFQTNIKDLSSYNINAYEQDVSTWKFNKLAAEEVFKGEEKEFGYFIFTPDLYGYSPRFALNYFQKRNPERSVFPYEKKAVTYLVIAPPPEYGRDPNSLWYQKNTNSSSWKANDIRIDRNPNQVINFKNGFVVEKYLLTEEELKSTPNPNLIKDIFFR